MEGLALIARVGSRIIWLGLQSAGSILGRINPISRTYFYNLKRSFENLNVHRPQSWIQQSVCLFEAKPVNHMNKQHGSVSFRV